MPWTGPIDSLPMCVFVRVVYARACVCGLFFPRRLVLCFSICKWRLRRSIYGRFIIGGAISDICQDLLKYPSPARCRLRVLYVCIMAQKYRGDKVAEWLGGPPADRGVMGLISSREGFEKIHLEQPVDPAEIGF